MLIQTCNKNPYVCVCTDKWQKLNRRRVTAAERPLTQIMEILKDTLFILPRNIRHFALYSAIFQRVTQKKNLQSTSGGWKWNSEENHTELTSATKLTMLMLKLTFCSEFISSWASIQGMESNQADTYMIGAERKVPITIPDVTCWWNVLREWRGGRAEVDVRRRWRPESLYSHIMSLNTSRMSLI